MEHEDNNYTQLDITTNKILNEFTYMGDTEKNYYSVKENESGKKNYTDFYPNKETINYEINASVRPLTLGSEKENPERDASKGSDHIFVMDIYVGENDNPLKKFIKNKSDSSKLFSELFKGDTKKSNINKYIRTEFSTEQKKFLGTSKNNENNISYYGYIGLCSHGKIIEVGESTYRPESDEAKEYMGDWQKEVVLKDSNIPFIDHAIKETIKETTLDQLEEKLTGQNLKNFQNRDYKRIIFYVLNYDTHKVAIDNLIPKKLGENIEEALKIIICQIGMLNADHYLDYPNLEEVEKKRIKDIVEAKKIKEQDNKS